MIPSCRSLVSQECEHPPSADSSVHLVLIAICRFRLNCGLSQLPATFSPAMLAFFFAGHRGDDHADFTARLVLGEVVMQIGGGAALPFLKLFGELARHAYAAGAQHGGSVFKTARQAV